MSVPCLDLSPKLKHPLSLRNAFDYVRLLYWVFFFPQTLAWYSSTFAVSEPDWNVKTISQRLKTLRRHSAGRLQLQGFIEAAVIPLVICLILTAIGVRVNWIIVLASAVLGCFVIIRTNQEEDVPRNLAIGMTISILGGTAIGIAYGLESNVAIGIAFGILLGVMINVSDNTTGGVGNGILYSWAIATVIGMAVYAVVRIINLVANIITLEMSIKLLLPIAIELVLTVVTTFVVGLAAGISVLLVLLRVETWALDSLFRRWLTKGEALVARVTLLPLPGLRRCIRNWLLEDWQTGLYNVDQLLQYSSQFIPVIGAVNDALAALPEESLLSSMEGLFEHPYGISLLHFATVSLRNVMIAEAVRGLFFVPHKWRERLLACWDTSPRLNTRVRAAAAGLWHLRRQQPKESAEAFESVKSLPYYDEVIHLARALAWARWASTDREVINLAEQPEFIAAGDGLPPVDMRLRPLSWHALDFLQHTVLEVRSARLSNSRAARLRALNNALEQLAMLHEHIGAARPTEHYLISDIARVWQEWLKGWKEGGFSVAGEDGKSVPILVMNPYQVGDPVVGHGFVGREDVLRRLEELWAGTSAPTSVVLFGHRRMGKTSILRNLPVHLGASVHLAHINLLLLGNAPGGVSEVLLALADGIARELRRVGRVAPEIDPGTFQTYAYRAFEHYLRSVREVLGEERLIIAVDEFEQLDEWMENERVPQDFLKVLRGYIQLDPHIAFAFAGLHVLEEMNADYFGPFFASVTPVRVGFLSQAAVNKALEQPTDDFPLRYEPEALERVWNLTAGQPYLVELIGYRLVNRFNDLAVDPTKGPEPCFKVTDVETVVNNPDFYQFGRYYFTGIWGQAGQGEPGQREVLCALAPHPEGLTLDELIKETSLDSSKLTTALEMLSRHDVIIRADCGWRYAVELMRRWVIQEHVMNNGEGHRLSMHAEITAST